MRTNKQTYQVLKAIVRVKGIINKYYIKRITKFIKNTAIRLANLFKISVTDNI